MASMPDHMLSTNVYVENIREEVQQIKRLQTNLTVLHFVDRASCNDSW
jgi:hypothetical protein